MIIPALISGPFEAKMKVKLQNNISGTDPSNTRSLELEKKIDFVLFSGLKMSTLFANIANERSIAKPQEGTHLVGHVINLVTHDQHSVK